MKAQTQKHLGQMRGISLFLGLPEAELERILEQALRRQFRSGEFLFFQDDPAEHLYLLVQGRVRLAKARAGEPPILMRVAQPPTIIGAVALAHAGQYPISAQASQDGEALYWSRSILLQHVSRSPQLALNAIDILAQHAGEFQDRFHQMVTERVERRLAHTLLRLASQVGKKTPEGILVDLPITRQDLAEMSGTTLYTVSRMLTQWEVHGLVSLGRERVVVRRPHGLVQIAEDINVENEEDLG